MIHISNKKESINSFYFKFLYFFLLFKIFLFLKLIKYNPHKKKLDNEIIHINKIELNCYGDKILKNIK